MNLQLPVGVVEHGEAPGAASERELAEELGLHFGPPRALLTASWTEPLSDTSRGWVTLLFDHGTHLAAETDEQILLQTSELSGWTWLVAADALEQLHPGQASLLAAARTGSALLRTEAGQRYQVGRTCCARNTAMIYIQLFSLAHHSAIVSYGSS